MNLVLKTTLKIVKIMLMTLLKVNEMKWNSIYELIEYIVSSVFTIIQSPTRGTALDRMQSTLFRSRASI